ncbi:hypothetical protein DFJ73DRAFT_847223 [Zopfochytrium polystomum]|nr:hypothetical protein DFJ73DRAFT_847223 [Zopfochytrium polystomum]
MADFVSASNQVLVAALLSLSLGVCFREQIGKIKNLHLSGSMWTALVFYFFNGVSAAVAEREFLYVTPSTIKTLIDAGYAPLLSATLVVLSPSAVPAHH